MSLDVRVSASEVVNEADHNGQLADPDQKDPLDEIRAGCGKFHAELEGFLGDAVVELGDFLGKQPVPVRNPLVNRGHTALHLGKALVDAAFEGLQLF